MRQAGGALVIWKTKNVLWMICCGDGLVLGFAVGVVAGI
jgi:hypothetical protein